jgi:osmotically-inducible protein OsmY
MQRRHRPFAALLLSGVALCAALLAAGCGDESEAERAARAAKELSSAREELTRAREDLAAKEAAAQAASGAAESARARLSDAEARVAAAASSEDLQVSDTALFRSVQERLLEDRALRDVAIRAQVTQGTVVLSGKVPDEKARERALELARGVPGVVAVDSQIEVAPAQ